jgi:hypothetical protein
MLGMQRAVRQNENLKTGTDGKMNIGWVVNSHAHQVEFNLVPSIIAQLALHPGRSSCARTVLLSVPSYLRLR